MSESRLRVVIADDHPVFRDGLARLIGELDGIDVVAVAANGIEVVALADELDPDVVLHADPSAVPAGTPKEVRSAPAVAKGALAFSGRARFAQPALVNGAVGVVVAPPGRLFVVLHLTIRQGRIAGIDVIADPERLRDLDLAVLED